MSSPRTTLQTVPRLAAPVVSRPVDRRLSIGWQAPATMGHREWVAAGRRFQEYGRINWWLGDWLRYGTSRWGEKYVEASRITGLEPKTLRNIVYVASAFELSRRRDNLTWSHHAEVAALKVHEQEMWLERAIAERLSPSDLRIELRATLRGTRDDPKKLDANPAGNCLLSVCPRCGFGLSPDAETLDLAFPPS
jgi:hypothetical protein